MKDLIKELTETYGPSGNEELIRNVIENKMKGLVDEIKTDTLGNLICIKKGQGAKVMLAAHMDEIGVVVNHIDKKGFLRFAAVGGVFPTYLLAHRVIFKNGIIGTFGKEEKGSTKGELKLEKMFIDIGAKDEKEASKYVHIGDVATYYRELDVLGSRFTAKAFDDRIGCAVLIETARKLKSSPNAVYFVFTVQEEVGLRGAKTSAYGIEPDIGIACDVTDTGDTPEAETMAVELGKGPCVKVKDRTIITPLKVKELMVSTAESKKIPYQLEILEWGGTDGGAIHLSRSGVPAGVISIPTRYVHTPSEVLDIGDVENAVRLFVEILKKNLKKEGF